MSRVGKLPIPIVDGVKVTLNNSILEISGVKGQLKRKFSEHVIIEYQNSCIVVKPQNNSSNSRALWGLSQRLISNMVKGVTEGYKKRLEIIGTGYKASIMPNNKKFLLLSLGFAHDIIMIIPYGIEIICEKPTIIVISGCDKELVGQVAADIRALKKPEPYKGKGIRYEGEKVRRKEGKKK